MNWKNLFELNLAFESCLAETMDGGLALNVVLFVMSISGKFFIIYLLVVPRL